MEIKEIFPGSNKDRSKPENFYSNNQKTPLPNKTKMLFSQIEKERLAFEKALTPEIKLPHLTVHPPFDKKLVPYYQD